MDENIIFQKKKKIYTWDLRRSMSSVDILEAVTAIIVSSLGEKAAEWSKLLGRQAVISGSYFSKFA